MASVILATAPIHGHVSAYLPIARHLVARGDRVRFVTGSRFAEVVADTGATHVTLPPESDFDDRMDVNATFPDRAALRGTAAIAFDVETLFVEPGRGQYDVLVDTMASEPADVVVADPVFIGAAHLLGHAAEQRPGIVVGSHLPLPLGSRDTAPYGMGLPPAPFLNRARNLVLHKLAGRLLRKADALADRDHRAIFGHAFGRPIMDWIPRADAIAQFTVAEFEYPRSDAPAHLHFVGPVQGPSPPIPAPDWWHELDGSRPVVHVTQGTIGNKDFGQLVAPALEGLADDDLIVVVSTGGRTLEALPLLPSNARAASYISYDDLLPKTDVFVTNGGYGGVQLALRHRLPIVVTGGQEDKPEVGARVAWTGVGIRLKEESPTPQALRKAVHRVLSDDRYRVAAGRLSARMDDAPGLDGLTRIIDDLAIEKPTTTH
jgi:UDP:flavonoid glycosyltransferase YjiC (YdhE family)